MSSNADRVEVFAGIQRRRRYTVDQKLAVLEEAAQPGMTISYVARRHGIALNHAEISHPCTKHPML
jgi:transposase